MTILRLNGTHGSGKSTVAYRLLRKYRHSVHQDRSAGPKATKPLGYIVDLYPGKQLYIVGPYTTACGGCDAVQPFADIWPRVDEASALYDHVLFEGALQSTTYGAQGKASEQMGADFVFAFLDTPLEECVRRVNQRRLERGVGPLTDTKNIDAKWHTINRLREKLEQGIVGAGQRTAIIDHTQPTKSVLALFGIRINKELA